MGLALTSRVNTFGNWPIGTVQRGGVYPTVEFQLWAQQMEYRTGGPSTTTTTSDLAMLPVSAAFAGPVDLAPVMASAAGIESLEPVAVPAMSMHNLEPV